MPNGLEPGGLLGKTSSAKSIPIKEQLSCSAGFYSAAVFVPANGSLSFKKKSAEVQNGDRVAPCTFLKSFSFSPAYGLK